MAGQLSRMADGRNAMPLELTRFNPRPPGVIREGSATDEVLKLLTAHPGRFFTYADIRARCTNRSHAALSWALIYARRMSLVQVAGDSRNPRYARYRIVKE